MERRGDFKLNTPTPLRRLEGLERYLGFKGTIWIKDDGVISRLYGGNKPRKLIPLLKRAREEGKSRLITTGGIGTNHGLATLIHGKEMGFSTTLYLYPQPLTVYVKRNLVRMIEEGGEIIPVKSPVESVLRAIRDARRDKTCFFIPPGGSTAPANAGFFFAVFELKKQMEEVGINFDAVFLPAGTCGTLTGVAVGWTNAELEGKIYGVAVVERVITNEINLLYQVHSLIKFLKDRGIKENVRRVMKRVKIVRGYLGRGYGDPTPDSVYAVNLIKDVEKLELETTYTGKALSALIDYAKERGKGNILFWNTHNAYEYEIPDLEERFIKVVEERGLNYLLKDERA